MSSGTMRSTLLPDAARMAVVRADATTRLRESLNHLVAEVLPLPDQLAEASLTRLSEITPARCDPALFGLNARLRDAALANDLPAFEAARGVFAKWQFRTVPSCGESGVAVNVLGLPDYDEARVTIMKTLFADDAGLTTDLVAPPPDLCASQREMIRRAWQVMPLIASEWAAELSELVSEVVLAVNASPTGRNFAGGSVFDLFGAVLVNPSYGRSIPHYLATLVHESSHLRLFCYHLDDAVVLNDPGDTYRSPLRRQPRPMEGVLHAAWVSARIAEFCFAVLEAPESEDVLVRGELAALREEAINARHAFFDGLEVIRQHGELTSVGQTLVDDAAAAMRRR